MLVRILQESVRCIRRNGALFAGFTAAHFALNLTYSYLDVTFLKGAKIVVSLIPAILLTVAFLWLDVAQLVAFWGREKGLEGPLTQVFAQAARKLPLVAFVGLRYSLQVGIGLLLLIAPGLYWLTVYMLVVPIAALESWSGKDPFARSRELVKPHFKGLLIFNLAFFIVLIAVNVGYSLIEDSSFASLQFLAVLVPLDLTDALLSSFGTVFSVIVYRELIGI